MIKLVFLYIYGYLISSFLVTLQLESRNLLPKFLPPWIPMTCGFAGVLLGSLIPLLDYLQNKKRHKSISDIIRCTGGTIGVNYAVCTLPTISKEQLQLALSLGVLVIGIWFLFDRSIHGLLCGLLVAVFGTLVIVYLVSLDVFSFRQSGLYGVPLWLPVLLFSACILMGVIGRGIDVIPDKWYTK